MQPDSQPSISIPVPIVIPLAPILPEHRLVFGSSDNADQAQTNPSFEEPPAKKRKKDRACDYCRRRKIKCDGPWRQGQVCTNCIHGHRVCTYIESSKPRGPPKAYVASLEDKVERLEDIIKQLCPNTDFSEEIGPPIVRGSWKNDDKPEGLNHLSAPSPPLTTGSVSSSLSLLTRPRTTATLNKDHDFPMSQVDRTTHLIFKTPRGSASPPPARKITLAKQSVVDPTTDDSPNESEEDMVESGGDGRHKYGLSAMENDDDLAMDSRIRFHGRSSTAGLVEVTRKFKHMCMQERQEGTNGRGLRLDKEAKQSPQRKVVVEKPDNAELRVYRRVEFWSTAPWETEWTSHNTHSPELVAKLLDYFPPEPVANELVELFFCHSNTYLPLLHRPTFERYWRERLHHDNVWFATLCILMFAVASRWYESGGEVLNQWIQGVDQWKAVGWKWFFVALDIHCARPSLSCPATLLEIQTFVLMVLFLRGTTCFAVGWLFVSIGLRKAQDRGAHRRTVYRNHPNVDDELWKRAFWILLAFDHILGASLGRGIATGQEDYDLDYPYEIDDEYWDTGNAETDFKQPSGVPSKISCFNQFLKIAEIIGFTAKTLYPVDKRKVFVGFVRGDWTEEVVRQLKMAMEEWVQKVPPHLRWSKDNPDCVFSRQAAANYALYYCALITIWRPFCAYSPTAPPRPDNDRQSTAMSQCTFAIKACAAVLEVEMQRGLSNAPIFINVSLVCAGTLALLLWVLRRKMVASGQGKTQIRNFEVEQTGIYISDLLDAVDICMRVLSLKKSTWEYAEAVAEQLKAALPSDRDKSFESLDIPMPSVQGISDVPGHFDPNSPTFQIPQDATFSFTDQSFYPMDSLQTGYKKSALTVEVKPLTDSSPSRQFFTSTLKPPQSRYPDTTISFTNNPLPSFPERAVSPTFYPVPSSEHAQPINSNVGHYPRRKSSQELPYAYSEMAQVPFKRRSQQSERQSRLSITDFVAPRPPVSVQDSGRSGVEFPRPRTPEGDRTSTLRSGPVVNDSAVQAKGCRQMRTRTTSLIDAPTVPSSASRKEIPSISSSMRRTSFPNLQNLKKDGYAGPLGTLLNKSLPNVAVLDPFHELVQPSLNISDARHLPSPSPTYSINRVPSGSNLSIMQSLNPPSRSQTKSSDRANLIPFASPGDSEVNDCRSSRSKELKPWTKLPPSTSDQHYTQHRFVHDTLSRP